MSYTNLIDLEGAVQAIEQFERPVVSIIKHTNPCGLAVGADVLDAFDKALASDPITPMIIAVNRTSLFNYWSERHSLCRGLGTFLYADA